MPNPASYRPLTLSVPWGDCDPAGIVFYPNLLSYFDRASWQMFLSAGLTLAVIQRDFDAIGFPIVEIQATFSHPCRFGDCLVIHTSPPQWSRRNFIIEHNIMVDGKLAVRGRETRIWGMVDPANPNGLRAVPIPPEIREKLTALF